MPNNKLRIKHKNNSNFFCGLGDQSSVEQFFCAKNLLLKI